MSTAQLLQEAVALARSAGFLVREDHLDGAGGGHCFVQEGRWLLLDVTQSLEEQLDDACDALADLPNLDLHATTPKLVEQIRARSTRQQPSLTTPALSESTIGHAA